MGKQIDPTDPNREKELGRVALWLDPSDLFFLASKIYSIEANEEEQEIIGRIKFRAETALHKAGLKGDDNNDLSWLAK